MKSFWNHFWIIWESFGIIVKSFWNHAGIILVIIMLGSCLDHSGMIVGSFWKHFGIILKSFWNHFGIIWESFGIIVKSFWVHVGIILGSFWNHFGTSWNTRLACKLVLNNQLSAWLDRPTAWLDRTKLGLPKKICAGSLFHCPWLEL